MGQTRCDVRPLQIHPTRQCNLRCLHCYSSSGPSREHAELDFDLLRDAVSDARAEGYNYASVSGGEPLLYSKLAPLLAHARRVGMATAITTNGILLDEKRIAALKECLDLVAISVDGPPETHNENRASPRAFEKMAKRLEGLRRSGLPFGFLFTLTQYNLPDLDWVARFAVEQGACLLHVHPLEESGRAAETLEGSRPDELELACAYLEVIRLTEELRGRISIHFDASDRGKILSDPESVYGGPVGDMGGKEPEEQALADLAAPLVIEADGTVVPIQHGFDRRYALGNLTGGAGLRALAQEWKRGRHARFQKLCQRTFDELAGRGELPLFNWYEAITRASAQHHF